MALAMTKGEDAETAAILAERRWGEGSPPSRFLKTAVGALDTLATGSGAELAGWNTSVAEFFSLVSERLIIGQMAELRRVPLRVRLISAATGTTAYWVGEGHPVPVSAATYEEDSLEPLKCVALTVVTDELLNSSDPAAERVVRDDLVRAVSDAINVTFIDPANSGSAGVKPASITNGVSGIASSGDEKTDVMALLEAFPGDLATAYFIGSPLNFAAMSGIFYPDVGARGGKIAGIPAIPSKAAEDNLILVDAAGIALGDGSAEVKVSREGTLEMLDNPTNDAVTPTATTMTSLWQTNSAAFMVARPIAWEAVRSAVSLVTGVSYVSGIS
jgi:hypothetical protein